MYTLLVLFVSSLHLIRRILITSIHHVWLPVRDGRYSVDMIQMNTKASIIRHVTLPKSNTKTSIIETY